MKKINRRQFIKGLIAVASAVTITPSAVFADENKNISLLTGEIGRIDGVKFYGEPIAKMIQDVQRERNQYEERWRKNIKFIEGGEYVIKDFEAAEKNVP